MGFGDDTRLAFPQAAVNTVASCKTSGRFAAIFPSGDV